MELQHAFIHILHPIPSASKHREVYTNAYAIATSATLLTPDSSYSNLSNLFPFFIKWETNVWIFYEHM